MRGRSPTAARALDMAILWSGILVHNSLNTTSTTEAFAVSHLLAANSLDVGRLSDELRAGHAIGLGCCRGLERTALGGSQILNSWEAMK